MSKRLLSNEIIRASAGTGKTYELSTRYLRLLACGVNPNAILATTFTCKAAGEILDRVVSRLAEAVLQDDKFETLADDIGVEGLSRENMASMLHLLVAHLHVQRVQTIDAFFSQITRAFSLEIGLPPNWQIVEESQMDRYRDRAIRRVLTRKNASQLVHFLTKGETTRSVTQLMRETVGSLYEIYREAPESAWQALKEQPLLAPEDIEHLVTQLQDAECPTDSMTGKLMESLQLVREENWDRFIGVGLGKKAAENEPTFNRNAIPDDVFFNLRKLASDAIARNLNFLVDQTRGAFLFLRDFDDEFDRMKLHNGALRFDDVNYLANALVDSFGADGMSYRLDQNIKHVLFDEFQDTSISQWHVVRPLVARALSNSEHRSFFCVGDVKQAIYRWRGGMAEIFDEVDREFSGKAVTRTKEQSYRSSPVVIEFVNRVFGNLTNHKRLEDYREPVQRWQSKFQEHSTCKTELTGYAAVEKAPANTDFDPWTALRVKVLMEQTDDQSIAVLTRTNDEVARITFQLRQLGIAASEEGGTPLTDSAAVNLILSALRLIDHPSDSIAQFHVAQSPLSELFGIKLGRASNLPWDKLDSDACQERNEIFRAAAKALRLELCDRGYGELIAHWAQELDPHCTRREWFRLGQLVEMGYRIGVDEMMRPAHFVEWIQNTPVNDPSTSRLRVMTIHKAKGLEFDVVVAPFLDFKLTGQAPNYIVGRRDETGPIDLVCRYVEKVKRNWLPENFQQAFDAYVAHEVHETISLLYVTLTRAKRAVHVLANPENHAGNKNMIGLVLSALEIDTRGDDVDDHDCVLWESGSQVWSKSEKQETIPRPHAKFETKKKTAKQTKQIKLAHGQSTRNIAWDSPSAREGGAKLRLGHLLELEENREQRVRGTLLHACFEKLHWNEDDQLPDTDQLGKELLQMEKATPAMVNRTIGEFRRMIKKPRTAALLSRAQYEGDLFQSIDDVTVENERRFTVKAGDRVLNGAVDRLVLLYRDGEIVGADVIDFKTDQLDANDLTALDRRVDVYRPQMLAYVEAIHKTYGLTKDNITARLAFVDIDQIVAVA